MLTITHGDILRADAEALVNTVNCVGVMGRGIALQFRKAFPENFKIYKRVCDKHELHPGTMLVHERNALGNPRFIINFPTKKHWKGNSKIEFIESGLEALVHEVVKRRILSIAVPPLGCGLGGLDWSEVRPLIESAFRAAPQVRVLLYEPTGTPSAARMAMSTEVPKMTAGRAALLGLMRRYLAAVLDPYVSLLEIHKLMYFMQEAGEPLRLRYAKAMYGPYASNLRHVLTCIDGHFIDGYGDAEDNPTKQIELRIEAAEAAETFLTQHVETQTRFDRVVRLIEGFESAFGMELLATVHWVMRHEHAATPEMAITKTYAWNERKKMFDERHIRIAWDTLHLDGWIPG